MASTWSITLSCGHAYELQSGTPDLKTPYICGACGNHLRSVNLAVRNKPEKPDD